MVIEANKEKTVHQVLLEIKERKVLPDMLDEMESLVTRVNLEMKVSPESLALREYVVLQVCTIPR